MQPQGSGLENKGQRPVLREPKASRSCREDERGIGRRRPQSPARAGSQSEAKGEAERKGREQGPAPGGRCLGRRSLRRRDEGGRCAAGTSILRVPGARASTVHAGIWDLIFSALLGARTDLSRFLHSMLSSCAPVQRAPERQVWPMPLPFPEMFRKRRSRGKGEAQRKWALNYIVLVLDWFHLGERLVSVDSFRVGCRLNKSQWKVVKRLTPLVDSWNIQTEVGPAEMGRCAAKVESVEEELKRLEEAARGPQRELRGYFGQMRMNRQRAWGCEGHPGESVGILEGGLEHVAKDLEPERLQFQGIPSFDPMPFLDKANQATYERPLDHAQEWLPEDLDLPRVKVRCKAGQRLKILEKLDEVKRLSLFREEDCRRGFANGLFGIPKDQTRDRMILDARRPNSVEDSERRWIYSLGSLAQFQFFYVEDDEDIHLHAEDLREFYHCFVVSEQRQKRNVLAGSYGAEEVQHLGAYHCGLQGAKKIVGALKTLAMGDTNAVAYGQVSHLSLLLRTGVFCLKDFMSLRMRPSRERIRAGLMIDDFLVVESRKRGEGGEEVRKKVEEVRRAYEKFGLPRHAGKAVEGDTEAEFWGAQLYGKLGILRPSLKKLVPLVNVVLGMLKLGYTTVGLLELLSGAFVAAFQVRRRLMSSLAEIYAAQRNRGRREIIQMSRQLKDELFCILGLLVVSCIDFRLKPATKLVASDASSCCEAAVATEVSGVVTRELQRHGLQKGLWNRLLSPEGPT